MFLRRVQKNHFINQRLKQAAEKSTSTLSVTEMGISILHPLSCDKRRSFTSAAAARDHALSQVLTPPSEATLFSSSTVQKNITFLSLCSVCILSPQYSILI